MLGHDAGEFAGLGKIGVGDLASDAAAVLSNADGVVDFTVPVRARPGRKVAEAAGIAHIIGTTGFSEDDEAKIKAAAAKTVIVKSGNMSRSASICSPRW